MKKHMIAAAVAAAVAAPVMAQNVSVYGVIDMGYQRFDSGTTNVTRAVDNGLATSRLGFRGSEDLGGGLKAIFQLEQRLNPGNGSVGQTLGNSPTTATNVQFNREAWVGLAGGFGELRLGTTDPTGIQAIDTSVSQGGDLFQNLDIDGAFQDHSSVVRYISPAVNGFAVDLGYSNGNYGLSADTTTVNKRFVGAMLSYTSGPLKVLVGTSKVTGQTSLEERGQDAIGASYDFGSFSLGGHYGKADLSTTSNSTDTKYYTLSAAIPLGNGVKLHAAYHSIEEDGTANKDADGIAFAVTKALSKRTTLYAAYASVDNNSGASYRFGPMSAPSAAGQDPSSFSVGISHSF